MIVFLVGDHLHAIPSEVNPPIPYGHASEIPNDEGIEKVIWSILVPMKEECLRKNFHRWRSLISSGESVEFEVFSACFCWYLNLVRKHLAKGGIYAA